MEQSPSPDLVNRTASVPPRRLALDELATVALGGRDTSMPWNHLYFQVNGRISRRTFWLHGVLSLLLVALTGNALLDIAGLASDVTGKLVNLLLAWPSIAVSGKRLHDFNRSAWWVLVNLVPGVGSLSMLVAGGCVPGTHGPNRYGDDPLDTAARRAHDYAVNSGH
jgi:uncharacterized membrane protein YhaH (DUF805 family)